MWDSDVAHRSHPTLVYQRGWRREWQSESLHAYMPRESCSSPCNSLTHTCLAGKTIQKQCSIGFIALVDFHQPAATSLRAHRAPILGLHPNGLRNVFGRTAVSQRACGVDGMPWCFGQLYETGSLGRPKPPGRLWSRAGLSEALGQLCGCRGSFGLPSFPSSSYFSSSASSSFVPLPHPLLRLLMFSPSSPASSSSASTLVLFFLHEPHSSAVLPVPPLPSWFLGHWLPFSLPFFVL